MATSSFTSQTGSVRKWKNEHPGAVIEIDDQQIVSTPTDADTRDLIAKLKTTLSNAPIEISPPIIRDIH